ncbi:hypothetical protein OQA88_2637 [Cercophora sp. LCS_1]
MAPLGRSAVTQPGFFFAPGPIFVGEGGATAHRIYSALTGQDLAGISSDETSARVGRSMAALFEAVLRHQDLFRALRGGPIVWDVVAQEASLFADIGRADVQLAVDRLVAARRVYRGAAPPTPLTALADQVIRLVDETAALGPPHTFSVAAVGAAAPSPAANIVDGLTASLRALDLRAPWPPAYFPVADLVVLADTSVRTVLGGVDPESPTPRPGQVVPVADSRSPPVSLRLALCRLALVSYSPGENWALYLKPVGYLASDDRWDWHHVLGRQAKMFETVVDFLDYAKEAFTSRNKTTAIGLFTHWLSKPTEVARVADITQTDPLEIWTNGVRMRRYGTVLVLRRINDQLQVVWHDPWRRSVATQEKFGHGKMAIFAYRQAVNDRIDAWARGHGITLHSSYWGGFLFGDPGHEDTVAMSLAFIRHHCAGVVGALSHPEDEAGFATGGYLRV